MNKVPVTVKGHELMKEELKRLKTIDRPNVVKAIAEARAHGDLRENAEYHAAKEQQGFIEARIKDLEGKLSHIHVIDVTAVDARGKIIFGPPVDSTWPGPDDSSPCRRFPAALAARRLTRRSARLRPA